MSKKLLIAEKPDMAKKIAQCLPGPLKANQGYLETPDWYVSYCVGHILEQCHLEEYDPKFEKWALEDLPFFPTTWKLKVSPKKAGQFKVIKDLLKQCTSIVHAGDPGREGQLIVDEVLHYLNNKKPVERLLINSLDKPSILKGLASLQDNRKFSDLYEAALGRQRADFNVGINLTRWATVLGQRQGGHRGVLSLGRVQYPLLCIVVRRELEIINFVPSDYAVITAHLENKGIKFNALWIPKGKTDLKNIVDENKINEEDEKQEDDEATQSTANEWFNDYGHITDLAKAEEIYQKLKKEKTAKVVLYQSNTVFENAPTPFELTNLQAHLNNKTGASATEVLEACQALYDAGYLSYPRTDSGYLKESQHQDAVQILKNLSGLSGTIGTASTGSNPAIKSPAFNDNKVGEHHGIIPTMEIPNLSSLSSLEKTLYEVVALRYIAQFYPPCEAEKTKIIFEIGQENFISRGRVVKNPGWRAISSSDDDNKEPKLPALQQGDNVQVNDITKEVKKTQPPSRYTEGTLLKQMKNVANLVSDPQEKKILRSIDGIGRSATRASIIKTLFDRNYIEKESQKSKKIKPTEIGMIMYDMCPPLREPGITAKWEHVLDSISKGQFKLSDFEKRQQAWVTQLMSQTPTLTLSKLKSYNEGNGNSQTATFSSSKTTGKTNTYSNHQSKSSSGNSSTNYKSSNSKTSTNSPQNNSSSSNGEKCTQCGKGVMVERTVKQGPHQGKKFFSCNQFPQCKNSVWPK